MDALGSGHQTKTQMSAVGTLFNEVPWRGSSTVKPVKAEQILDMFDEVVVEVAEELSALEDWGKSGNRPDQYNHDVVADDVVVSRILESGFRVLTEESGITEPAQTGEGDDEITIVVDPVDGSTNASRGLPWYAVSLCAVDNEGPFAAHVSNLSTGDRFRAVRGGGVESHLNEVTPSTCTELSEALLAFSGLPPEHGGWKQYRTYGAAALDICAVATGAFDGYMDVGSYHGVWDYLGAGLVCAEVGVELVDAEGRDPVILDHAERRAPTVAATPELLEQMLEMRRNWPPAD